MKPHDGFYMPTICWIYQLKHVGFFLNPIRKVEMHECKNKQKMRKKKKEVLTIKTIDTVIQSLDICSN